MIRYSSAKRIVELVECLLQSVEEEDILVLTPFRAQRTLVRAFLRNAGHKSVAVSTVHRAQGREQHTVIFDPVDGNSKFASGPEAQKLVNVALSRAKARLVLLFSEQDRGNCIYEQICTIIKNYGIKRKIKNIMDYALADDFPDNVLEMEVAINGQNGKVVEVYESGAKFRFRDYSTGALRTFTAYHFIAKAMGL
jgi:superfamily I DNA/RNA helicase